MKGFSHQFQALSSALHNFSFSKPKIDFWHFFTYTYDEAIKAQKFAIIFSQWCSNGKLFFKGHGGIFLRVFFENNAADAFLNTR